MPVLLPSFWTDLRLAVTVMFCGALSGANIAKLAPTVESLATSFDMSLSQLGLLASIFTLVMVLAGVLIGSVVEGVGAKRTLVTALLVGCAGNFISLVGDTLLLLFIGRAIEGFSLIALTLTAPSILTRYTNPAHRGWVMGVWGGFMPMGNALAIITAALLIGVGGWQIVWKAGLAFSVLVTIIAVVLIPKDLEKYSLKFDISSLALAIRLPLLGFIGLCFALHSLVYQTLIQFMPLMSQSLGGFTLAEGAFIAAFFCMINFIGNLLAGQLLQRGWRPALIVRLAFAAIAILLLALAGLSFSPPLFIFLLILIGFVSGGSPPVFFYLASRSSDNAQTLPVFIAWVFQIQGLGMLIGPALVSRAVDTSGSWIIGILCLVPACLLVVIISGFLRLPKQPQ